MPLLHAGVTLAPLDAEHLRARVSNPAAGAVTCFLGQIRDHDPEARGTVTGIEYTAHPDADAIIATVVTRVLAEGDAAGVAHVAAVHRIGTLAVGDLALVVCVATPHRQLGFDLCEAIVEAVKAEVPIWKRQHESDGRAVWSNLGLPASEAP